MKVSLANSRGISRFLFHMTLAVIYTAILTVAAMLLTSCQEEDFGFTVDEINQTRVNREYAAEFSKEFPNVDPEHTWMCVPDTIYGDISDIMHTRAAGDAPTIQRSQNASINMSYSEVQGALNFMKEGDENYGKTTQDFEFLALNDKGTGQEVYTITPTFWGRKFCANNEIGVYYIDANGNKQDLNGGTFWSDKDNHIQVYFKDGSNQPLTNSDQQIIDDPSLSNYALSIPLTHKCSRCNGYNNVNVTLTSNADANIDRWGNNNSFQKLDDYNFKKDVYKVSCSSNTNTYGQQLFITTNGRTWRAGDTYRIHMWAMATVETQLKAQTQNGTTHYAAYISGLDDLKITKEWKEITWEGTIPTGSETSINTIALDLAHSNQNVTYYFSEITWEKTPCDKCVAGKSPVDHYALPEYTLTVPAGTTWGLYLKTQKQQNGHDTSEIKWYSNSQHNADNHDGSNTKVQAAATFTYDNVTYVSFEDAPTKCTGYSPNAQSNGHCSVCGRGHYDHDFNDIVLTITPRPATSTYRSISYRVMCEDLGGTFDWDFNDVVYDVIYADGKTNSDKATVKIILQAVGGTLPIYVYYGNELLSTGSKSELHEWSTDQTPDDQELYLPVNVKNCDYSITCSPVTLKTFELAKQIYSTNELDIRDYVKNIVIRAKQKNGITTEVTFPKETGDATPQCFMTSTGTEWADEIQNINDKYKNFKSWCSDREVTGWYSVTY